MAITMPAMAPPAMYPEASRTPGLLVVGRCPVAEPLVKGRKQGHALKDGDHDARDGAAGDVPRSQQDASPLGVLAVQLVLAQVLSLVLPAVVGIREPADEAPGPNRAR